MSVEANKEVVRRIIEEVWNGGRWALVDGLIAVDAVDHDLEPGARNGLAGVKQQLATFRAGFSSLHITIEELVGEGDKVVARLTWRGVQDGVLWGIPPCYRSLMVTNIVIYRLVDGKVVDVWRNQDSLGMLVQMGVAPPPGTGPLGALGFVARNLVRMPLRALVGSLRKRRVAPATG